MLVIWKQFASSRNLKSTQTPENILTFQWSKCKTSLIETDGDLVQDPTIGLWPEVFFWPMWCNTGLPLSSDE